MDNKDYLLTSSQYSQQFSASLWDYNTLNVLKLYRNGGTAASNCLELISDDFILTGELAKPLLHVWVLNSQEVSKNIRLILPEPAACLAVCPKQVYLAVGMTCKLYIWHISSGKLLSVQQKNYQPITCIKFSSDGEFVLVGGQDGMLVVYNLCDLLALSSNYLAQTDIGQVEPVYVKSDHSLPITDLHVGTFGKKSRFATVSNDQTCRLYNLLTGENLLTLVFDEPLFSVIFDACCWQLYVGGASGVVRAFNLQQPPRSVTHHVDKKISLTFEGHTKKVTCLALNSCNTVLATGSDDNFVFTWDIKSRQILKKIEHKAPVTNIKFVMAYENFFADVVKPRTVINTLGRNTDFGSDFKISQIQLEDIELSDDENSLENQKIRESMKKENTRLRVINKQLYNAALEIRKKYCNNVKE
nr:unnamed protein product [Callosobruchus chinensis]